MDAEQKTDERLSKQRAMFETKLSQAAEEKAALTDELQNVAAKHQRQISKAVEEAEQRKDQEKQAALVEQRKAMEKRIADAEASVEEFKALYTKENRLRKLVNNKLLELQVCYSLLSRHINPEVSINFREIFVYFAELVQFWK